jgi:hypothetical protein
MSEADTYAAHGFFENYKPLAKYTRADLFQRAGERPPPKRSAARRQLYPQPLMFEACGASLSQLSYQCADCNYAEAVVHFGHQVSPTQRLTGATFY